MYYKDAYELFEDRRDMRFVKCGWSGFWVPKQVQAWDKRAKRKTPYKPPAKPSEIAWKTHYLLLTRGFIK